MRSRNAILRFAIPLAVALVLIGVAVWRGTAIAHRAPPPPPALGASQLAARAGLLPVPATILATVPIAGEWSRPMGTRGGAFTYNAQPYLAANPARGGFHLGDDLNGIGQENTDLDCPVFAAADGMVAYAGQPSPGWGGVVILLHRTDAGLKQTFYGHLNPDSLAVTPGERVARGRRLGRLALTTAVDFAHLHFELRHGAGVVPGPGYHPAGSLASENPAEFLAARLATPGLPSPMDLARSGESRATRSPPDDLQPN